MSQFDSNPFDDEAADNPYAASQASSLTGSRAAPPRSSAAFFDDVPISSSAPSVQPQLSSVRMTPLPPESRSGSAFDAASDIPFSPKSLKKKQKELQAKEAKLRQKERELASREENLGLVRPNWPPFFPLIRHDIKADIPEHLRSVQRLAFITWLGAVTALCFNFIAVLLGWVLGALSFTTGVGCFFLALIMVLTGVPLSFFLWYRRLYNSLKNDSSIGLVLFFISYTSHICWFTIFTIAPPIFFGGYFMCGVLTTIGIFSGGNIFIGILYIVGTALFGSVAALSIVVIGRVFAYFRGAKKADQLKQEAAVAALQNAV